MKMYEELKARGLLAQVTDEEEIRELLNNGKATFYIGFVPTADSLHVGHFMALCLMKRLQMAGNRPIALVGGGIGTAPLYQLARERAAAGRKPDVFFGFRDEPYCMEQYRGLVKVSTDSGRVGFHGFVTQLYDPAAYDVVLICGPTPMMRNAARLCAENGTPCLVSLEKKMACGIGACLGCTIETASGARSVCKDGPVFAGTEVFGWQT